eukprot:TRINITY_DN8619_c0_g1_i1.p1 TRINITY_DN8619_c0_g1~~TRINITY_DN8619_c0_g1_i1.p1  ORF type:complete len:164 (+),score=24.41 TRINITY_DN8619_c0_g1_i1:89-580(+)
MQIGSISASRVSRLSEEISVIIPGFLFLGSVRAAYNQTELDAHNITFILNVAASEVPSGDRTERVLELPMKDEEQENLLPFLPRAFQFLQDVKNEGGCVLVHCVAGKSRSAAVIVAYLMASKRISFPDSLKRVQRARSVIHLNNGFLRQLRQFDSNKQLLDLI